MLRYWNRKSTYEKDPFIHPLSNCILVWCGSYYHSSSSEMIDDICSLLNAIFVGDISSSTGLLFYHITWLPHHIVNQTNQYQPIHVIALTEQCRGMDFCLRLLGENNIKIFILYVKDYTIKLFLKLQYWIYSKMDVTDASGVKRQM